MTSSGGILAIPLGDGAELDFAPRKAAARAKSLPGPLRDFIADDENMLVRALLPALDRGDTAFRPLVLCGPTCTGKTVLALALARHFHRHEPDAKVVLTTAVDFVRAYAHAVDTDALDDFREKYTEASLVVIDDLPHLQGKTAAQQELRYLLDRLVDRQASVIITSRTPPSELPLSADLRGRLSQGLVVPLRWPGESARRAMIARYLAERRVSDLSEACVTRLAGTYAGPPSRLFAALAQIVHVAQTDRRELNDALVEETLDGAEEHAIAPRAIIAAVAKQFHITQADLKGPSRRQAISEARGIAMHLLRELTHATFENIGQQFGGRDHTTVMHACQKTSERLAADERLRQTVESLAGNLEESL